MDDLIGKLSFFRTAPDTAVAGNTANKKNSEPEQESETTELAKKPAREKMNSADSLAMRYKSAVPLKYLMAVSDSLLRDSSGELLRPENPEGIVVKKDELLSSRNVTLVNISAPAGSSGDSLLLEVSGIRDDRKNVIVAFTVEFWQSPINYKGYKMGKNKIILFGISSGEEIKLYRLNDEIYMKRQQQVYHLDYSNDFSQFERVNDQFLLAKLK